MMRLPLHPPERSVVPLLVAALALSIGVALLTPRGAGAAAAPQLLPQRDVEIRYTVSVPGQPPHDYDLAFSAESERARIDDPARGLWFLVDLRNATAALVVPGMHAVVTEPDLAGLAGILQSAKTAQFVPFGEATIAGLRCTRYRVNSEQAKGTACLTRDGIALAVSGEDSRGSARVIADSVTEAVVPGDRLAPPHNFLRIALPRGAIAALLGN
ncbi:MAG: hypothetical protein ACREFP_16795 [Acetobacteraceae bacterium]